MQIITIANWGAVSSKCAARFAGLHHHDYLPIGSILKTIDESGQLDGRHDLIGKDFKGIDPAVID